MSPEDSESRAAQKRLLNGSLTPAAFYSKTPRSSMAPASHIPSSLRHTSAPGLPTTAPGSNASFAIVIGSPANGFASPSFGSLSTTTKKRGRSFKNPQATPTPPIAKKGRPFKTPEAAAAATARTARGSSNDQLPKKRGRPFKYPQDPEEVVSFVPPEPKFVPFICEWKNCPAELHNLDTLRAHLITVHLKKQSSSGPLTCLWRKCCQEHKVVDETGASKVIDKGVEFKTKEEWRNHVEVTHLDHVARFQGDGPKTEMSFTKKPRPILSYSFRHGGPEGQATPSVRNQPIEGGRAKDNNAARFRKKRDGLYVVFEPVENPKLYMKVDDDDDEGDDMDEL